MTPELKALTGQYQKIQGKAPSKRTVWLLGRQAAQNTRRTKAEARRTVAGQAGIAEPSEAQRLAAWEAQTARREVQALSAVHQEVARFAAGHALRAPAVLDDAARRRAARIAVTEVQRQHAVVAHELAAGLDRRARALGDQLAASPEPWLAGGSASWPRMHRRCCARTTVSSPARYHRFRPVWSATGFTGEALALTPGTAWRWRPRRPAAAGEGPAMRGSPGWHRV